MRAWQWKGQSREEERDRGGFKKGHYLPAEAGWQNLSRELQSERQGKYQVRSLLPGNTHKASLSLHKQKLNPRFEYVTVKTLLTVLLTQKNGIRHKGWQETRSRAAFVQCFTSNFLTTLAKAWLSLQLSSSKDMLRSYSEMKVSNTPKSSRRDRMTSTTLWLSSLHRKEHQRLSIFSYFMHSKCLWIKSMQKSKVYDEQCTTSPSVTDFLHFP